jgi:transposase
MDAMGLAASLFWPEDLGFMGATINGAVMVVELASRQRAPRCPGCGTVSRRVHSRYARQLRDLPCIGYALRLVVAVRRLRCATPSCPRRFFTERLERFARPYARMSERLRARVAQVAHALGGRAGARLGQYIGVPLSGRTLIRRLLEKAEPPPISPKVVGIDEWAYRRGHRYGTLIVDLERRQLCDLLPDRNAASTAEWLRAHPTIEIGARDRSGLYAEALASGAAPIRQVADRWHLVRNLRDCLEQICESQRQRLQVELSAAIPAVAPAPPPTLPDAPPPLGRCPPRPSASKRWAELAEEAVARHRAGEGIKAIARALGLERKTVRRYVRAGGLPPRRQRLLPHPMEPYRKVLWRRWREGCHKVADLHRHLVEQYGYTGTARTVERAVQPWRRLKDGLAASPGLSSTVPEPLRLPGPRRLAIELIRREPSEQFLKLHQCCSLLQKLRELAGVFLSLVCERQSAALDGWLAQARESGLSKLVRFAKGIEQDLAAVRAALELPWSNGQTEGQINRLKAIKRQMFGRAGFDLLRARVMPLPG